MSRGRYSAVVTDALSDEGRSVKGVDSLLSGGKRPGPH